LSPFSFPPTTHTAHQLLFTSGVLYFQVANSHEQIVALNVIEIQNCTFKYSTKGLDGHVPVCTGLNVSIPLGKMIWMTNGTDPGVEGVGRLTLMKLMAGLLLPDKGHINVPAHLNVLFVHHEPMLLAKSLWTNLTLGNPDAKEEDVWRIAVQMGMSKTLVGKRDLDVGDHGNNLRICDKQAICIARAVIANPDVLLLHRPGELFTETDKHAMLDGIQEYIGSGRTEGSSHATILQTKTAILSIDDDADEKVPRNCDVVCKVEKGAVNLYEPEEYATKYLQKKKKE
jgi:ABC-type transport system involved in cytochrome bd biosynthesis fused ATPase/permease subunit